MQKTHSNTLTDMLAVRPKKIKTHDKLVQAEELISSAHLDVRRLLRVVAAAPTG